MEVKRQKTLMRSKKGVELSVNFLVTFILGIVLFSLGILFATKLFTGAEDIAETSQAQLDRAVEDLFCSKSEQVCLNTNTRTLQRGQQFIFGVNVVNHFNTSTKFKLTMQNKRAFDKENQLIFNQSDERPQYQPGPDKPILSIMPEEKEFFLGANLQERTGVLVKVLPKNWHGQYILDVDVFYDVEGAWERYGTVQKIYVTVP